MENTELIWTKFEEIYHAFLPGPELKRSEKEKQFVDLFSGLTLQIIENSSGSTFQALLRDYPAFFEIQLQYTKDIVRSGYMHAMAGGYCIYLAERLVDNKPINKIGSIEFKQLVLDFSKTIRSEIKSYTQKASPDTNEIVFGTPIVDSTIKKHFRLTMIDMGNATNWKTEEISKELLEKIIQQMNIDVKQLIICGYMLGVAESHYRQK